jgi:hypothetical protein
MLLEHNIILMATIGFCQSVRKHQPSSVKMIRIILLGFQTWPQMLVFFEGDTSVLYLLQKAT